MVDEVMTQTYCWLF